MMRGMRRQTRTRTSSPAEHVLGPILTGVVGRARGVLHGLEITLDIALAGVLVVAIALIGADTVGLVAVVRRVLVVTAQAERLLSAGGNIEPIPWELGALAGLILSLAIALSLARRHGDGPRDLQAD